MHDHLVSLDSSEGPSRKMRTKRARGAGGGGGVEGYVHDPTLNKFGRILKRSSHEHISKAELSKLDMPGKQYNDARWHPSELDIAPAKPAINWYYCLDVHYVQASSLRWKASFHPGRCQCMPTVCSQNPCAHPMTCALAQVCQCCPAQMPHLPPIADGHLAA